MTLRQLVADTGRFGGAKNSDCRAVVRLQRMTRNAALPVRIDFLGLPFSEPKLFEIAGAYDAVSSHRMPPPDFGPVDTVETRALSAFSATPRPMPAPRTLSGDEPRAIQED